MKRTDIHRPSVINPADYKCIGFRYTGVDKFMIEASRGESLPIKAWCQKHEVEYGDLDFGGQCNCCGARAAYWRIFEHTPTMTLVRFGHICAAKLKLVKSGEFKQYRKGLNTKVIHLKNVASAQEFCKKWGIEIEKFAMKDDGSWEQRTLQDLWFKCIQYHSLTEKQIAFAKKLIDKIEHPVTVADVKRDPAVEGKQEVHGKILGFKHQESQFGTTTKALIETVKGWKLYATVPSGATWEKGNEVKIMVTVEVSKDDPYFAFGKRPKLIKENV